MSTTEDLVTCQTHYPHQLVVGTPAPAGECSGCGKPHGPVAVNVGAGSEISYCGSCITIAAQAVAGSTTHWPRPRRTKQGKRGMPRNKGGLPITGFVLAQRRAGLAKATITKRTTLLLAFERWLEISDRSLLDAAKDDVERWLDSTPITNRSRYSYISNLASFYAWALDEDLVDADPTAKIRRPRYGRSVPRPIGDADLLWAMRQAPPRMLVWICLAAYEGLRCKEIAGVMVDDVLLDDVPPLLIVSAAKYDRQRVVPVNPNTEEALRAYGMPRAGALFPRPDGPTPMAASSVSKLFNAFLHGHGVTATAHQLRHWFGTSVYRQTRDLRLTQELLGHASPNSTAMYTLMSPSEDGTAVVHGLQAVQPTIRLSAARPVTSSAVVEPAGDASEPPRCCHPGAP